MMGKQFAPAYTSAMCTRWLITIDGMVLLHENRESTVWAVTFEPPDGNRLCKVLKMPNVNGISGIST